MSFIILLPFLGIVTVSMMNLLIGIAMGDISKLYKQGDQFEFKSKVEHICQVFYIFRMGNFIHRRKLQQLSSTLKCLCRGQAQGDEKAKGAQSATLKEKKVNFLQPFERHYKRYQRNRGMTIEQLHEEMEQNFMRFY